MHVTIARNDLLHLLDAVIGSAEHKGVRPTLAHVLLATETDAVRASCTNLYRATSGTVAAEVTEPGSVSVGAKALHDRVKTMPLGPVDILATEGAQVTVKAVGAPRRFGMAGIPGHEFPNLPQPPADAVWFEIDATILERLLAGTSYAMSGDETRPQVHATLVEWQGTTLRCVTTDGHRLAKAEAKVDATKTLTMLVDAGAIGQITRLVAAEVARGDKATKVRLTTYGPSLFLDVAGVRFSTKLVEATFPPYHQVIGGAEGGAVNVLRADRDKLAETLMAVQVSSEDGNIRLDMVAADAGGTLRMGNVLAAKAAKGESLDEMAVEYTGPKMRLGCQAKYLEQALGAMPEGDVVMKLGGELDPILVTPATEATGESVVAVVMPARIEMTEAVMMPNPVKSAASARA